MFHVKHNLDDYLRPFRGSSHETELATALTAAWTAGSIIADRWNTPVALHMKGAVDIVSEVDLAAEHAVIDTITSRHSEDQIIAEESGAHGRIGAREWHIDPLDGTTNFTHGFPQFCTSIALAIESDPVLGVIYDPIRNWTFYGMKGFGSYRNGNRLCVSKRTTLADSF